jgi:hypothetical protein
MKFDKVDDFLREHMNIVPRYSRPTYTCKEPFGTQWHMMSNKIPKESTVCFVQLSKDEQDPCWVRLGELLEAMFFEKTNDPVFMHECITKFLLDNKEILKIK